jgi:type VI secretion system secreted protein Hcp
MATSYFLKIDGIDGESVDAKHKNEIDIESWSWGATNTRTLAAGGGGGAGKVSMQDFSFVTRTNRASPKLMLACATGQHIKKAVLTVRKAGGEQQEYYRVTLTDLLVSGFSTGGAEANVVPTDQFSLNFSKIEVEYRAQEPDGKLAAPVNATIEVRRR